MRGFLGREGFVWWHGVVEDTGDPLCLGRCRVRVFGFHTADKTELPTDALPWAYPMQPITSAAISGIGQSPTGLLNGSHVFGFFRDGEEAQDPVMIGTFGGIPMNPADPNVGFNDPNGEYPKKNNSLGPPGISIIQESDTNRLARNDTELSRVTVVIPKVKNLDLDVKSTPDMKGSSTWNEPVTPYNAEYPKNHVRYTESGHIEEYDDTPGSERLHHYHTSGTFTEIGNGWESDPNGTRVQRIVGNDYEIVHGHKKVHIRGKEGLNLVIDGSANITINNGGNIQINGDMNLLANNNVNLQIEGSLKVSGKSIEFYSDENIGFSGKTISFVTDKSVMVMQQEKRIEVNSGEPVVNPKRVDVKGGG